MSFSSLVRIVLGFFISAGLSYVSLSLWMNKLSPFSLDCSGLTEDGVPFSRPTAACLAKLLLLQARFILQSCPLLSFPPRWGLLQMSDPFQLALNIWIVFCWWTVLSLLFMMKVSSAPSRYMPQRLYCCSGQGKLWHWESQRDFIQGHMSSLQKKLIQNLYCRLSALWIHPKMVLSFWVCTIPVLLWVAPVHFVMS